MTTKEALEERNACLAIVNEVLEKYSAEYDQFMKDCGVGEETFCAYAAMKAAEEICERIRSRT
jgi:hypothetical protein